MSKYKLIDGEFSVDEAKELIGKLLEYKIQFHSRQNFSHEIRNGHSDELSLKRKEELTRTKQLFLEQMAGLEADKKLVINADITIM